MNRRVLTLSAAAVTLGLLSAAGRAADPSPGKKLTPIFNGQDLSGWHGWAIHEKGANPTDLAKLPPEERQKKIDAWTADAKKHWTAENGELVNDGHGAYLATDKEYGDFEFVIEYKTVPKADSGIYLRATPQVQIWDPAEEDKGGLGKAKGSGGLWNNAKGAAGKDPLVKADKPLGEWNKFHIVMVGEKVTVRLNDELVVDHAKLDNFWNRSEPVLKKAPILLQTHGGEIRWRNIAIRDIPPDEANELLRKKGGTGFRPVFDGKTLAGWGGPVGNYEVVDGALVCKPKKGGTIFTQDRFADFVARLEYKAPPGGNNGLAIRYPGKGQASQEAMCEVQVLDDDAPKYAKLDPRQFNGSAYGMAAARRGFGRPAGEWNFMQVTVQGPSIAVELNGTEILYADLSTVTEYKDGTHPGKGLKEGHFGFCGHNDPVAFRNVEIKPLAAK